MPRAAATTSLYSVHPGVAMVQKWVDELPAKTGRSLDEWLDLVKKSGPATEKERRDWLKTEHKLGTNSAWWIAERAEGKGGEDSDPAAYLKAAEGWVDEMFGGARAGLRPIYDELLKISRKLGTDVRFCPCKTIVPFYRNHVFAQVKPATRTRIDFGLSLKGVKVPKRLLDTGGQAKGDRITHRIPLTSLAEIDNEVKHWLKVAYDLDEN
jgi:hypothetical protein